MKKLLLILTLFALTISVKAQFSKPTGAVTIPTYSFFRTAADSGVHIYQGSVNLYNTFLMKWDSVKVKGYFTNWKILQYRKLNNHDSLSTLDERKYQSLTDTITWGLGLSQSGHVTKVDTSSASILSRQRALHEYALISHNQSISTIIGLLDSLNNHYTKAQADSRFTAKNDSSKLYKFKIDSTAADGYTRRDRLATELFLKVTKNANITPGSGTKITADAKGLVTTIGTANTYEITPTANRQFITPADSIKLDNLADSLLARYTKTQSDARFAPISHSQAQSTITALADSLLARYTKT